MIATTRVEAPLTEAQRAKNRRDVERRVREIKHQIRLDRIRADGAKLKEVRRQTRRLQEAITFKVLRLRQLGGSITVEDRQQLLDAAATGVVRPGTQAEVERYRRHTAALAAGLGVHVEYVDAIRCLNGYAWPRLKVIEVTPIATPRDYATVLHELGHVARPCEPTHHRAKGQPCLVCELSAWRWAMQAAQPAWTRAMHAQLKQSLPTYKRYGTQGQQREIDALCALGCEQERQRRLRAGR